MNTQDRSRQEREAIDRLLATGIFDRSPNLALFLRYVCARYFEGRVDELREYNIAVVALGRPASFDQKRDAIVRVEAHRLRKRLQQHYAGKGANEPVYVDLPAGSYAPQFHFRDVPAVENGVELARESVAPLAPVEPPPSAQAPASVPAIEPARPGKGEGSRWPMFLLAAVLLLIAAAVYLGSDRQAKASPATVLPPVPVGELSEVRILAGSHLVRYVDSDGNLWSGDRFFSGGSAESVPLRPILRTSDTALYLTRRQGYFQYDIPLKQGTYELRLHFAETIFGENNIAGGGESSRLFAIRLNGQPLIGFWDPLADAGGGNIANIKVFRDIEPASDGFLHLEFRPSFKEAPFVNAIEVIPGIPGRMRPVRIIPSPTAFTDTNSIEWAPDRYFTGGQPVQRNDEIPAARDQALYRSERYGNFTYAIPVVAQSRYTATLRFCEHWFGPGRPGGGGVGSRVFDVYMNGRVLLENFDIFKEAGGALQPLDKTFHNLRPNAQGKLVFQFVPVRNYALSNGFSIVDEGS